MKKFAALKLMAQVFLTMGFAVLAGCTSVSKPLATKPQPRQVLVCSPPVLNLTIPAGPRALKRIVVRSENGSAFEVTRVDTPQPGITVDIKPVSTGVVEIVLDYITPNEDLDRKPVTVHTTAPGFQTLSIPFQVFRDG